MLEDKMSENTKYDVVGMGNAIVDILTYTDEKFLAENNLPKGGMTLIDEKTATKLYKSMGAATECSGGSAANTLAGLASLGMKTAFIGKVKNDQLGEIFYHDMNSLGVDFSTRFSEKGKPTAQCLVFVTHEGESKIKSKNAERTMATYLGASTEITSEDVDKELIKNARVTYVEGYLWDGEKAKEAVRKAINIAHDHGRKVAFTLSDSFCVERHREEFIDLVENHIDILFANEREIGTLYQEADIRKILYRLSGICDLAAVTRSANGSYLIGPEGDIYPIDAVKVDDVYDVTGAGDLYASGVLYGYVRGMDMETCGRIGSLCAAEVIKYLGGRPLTELSDLVEGI